MFSTGLITSAHIRYFKKQSAPGMAFVTNCQGTSHPARGSKLS